MARACEHQITKRGTGSPHHCHSGILLYSVFSDQHFWFTFIKYTCVKFPLRVFDFCFYQYYATVDSGNDFEEDCYPWLSKENVEDRTEEDLSGLPEMVSSGHSVGGVVYSTIPGTKVNYRLTTGTVLQLIVESIELHVGLL